MSRALNAVMKSSRHFMAAATDVAWLSGMETLLWRRSIAGTTVYSAFAEMRSKSQQIPIHGQREFGSHG
jgi:hypothetical protein